MSFVGIKPGTPDSGRAVPQNEGAKERLERLEREWAEEKRKAKEKRDAGPKLRWTPPAVERLGPIENEVYKCIMAADKHNDGDDNELMYVLNKNEPDVNFTYCGQSMLFIACNHGKYGVVQLLLRWPHPQPIDIMKTSDAGETPFLAACRIGHVKIAQLLMAQPDMDPNRRANDGRSPIWCACIKGHVGLLQWLLDSQEIGVIDWESAANGLEGFDPPRKITCIGACRAAMNYAAIPLVEEGVKRQRTKRAKARFKRAQAGAKVAVRLRDADGVFFGTDTFDSSKLGEMTRERHDLGNEHGIDFGGLRKKQADAMQSEDGSLDFDKLLAIAAEANKPPEPEPEPEPAPPADPAHVVKEHKNKHQRPKNET